MNKKESGVDSECSPLNVSSILLDGVQWDFLGYISSAYVSVGSVKETMRVDLMPLPGSLETICSGLA